jgi:hypothetical protein
MHIHQWSPIQLWPVGHHHKKLANGLAPPLSAADVDSMITEHFCTANLCTCCRKQTVMTWRACTTELHLHLRPHVSDACDQPEPPPRGGIQVLVQYYLEESPCIAAKELQRYAWNKCMRRREQEQRRCHLLGPGKKSAMPSILRCSEYFLRPLKFELVCRTRPNHH